MARTVADVFAQARGLLQDRRVPYRYPDADLLACLNEAISETQRLRPDLFVGRAAAGTPLLTTTDTLPIHDMFFSPLVSFVAGRIELRDDTFTNDGRASSLVTMFYGALRGGVA